MPIAKRKQSRRPGRWGLRSWNLFALGALGLGAGCHLLPVHRIDPSIDPRRVGRSSAVEEAAALPPKQALSLADRSVPLPPLPLQVMSDDEALQRPSPTPTPLLDAALQRADQMQESLTAEVAVERVPHVANEPKGTLLPRDDAAQRLATGLLGSAEAAPAEEAPLQLPEDPVMLAAAEPSARAVSAKPKPAKPPEPEPAVNPTEPADPWGDGIAALQAYASSQLAKADEGAEDWRLRRRLLDWLAEERPDAGPMEASWSSVLSILAAATPEEGPVDVRATARALQERAPLQITHLQLCKKVRGFGDFDPLGPDLKPKQGAVLYCELNGVEAEEKDGVFHSRLDATISLHAPGSETPVWTQALERAVDACRRRRLDYFVAYRFSLPETIEPGTYILTVRQHDAVADREVSESMQLVVIAP